MGRSPVDNRADSSVAGATSGSALAAARCVLWSPQESSPSPELTAVLAARGVTISLATNRFEAVAMLVEMERLARPPTPGAPRAFPAILIVDRPAELVAAPDVVRVAGRYAPRVAIWSFEPARTPRLAAVRAQDLARWEDPPTPAAPEPPEIHVVSQSPHGAPFAGPQEPLLKLAGDGSFPIPAAVSAARAARTAEHDQELQLVGDVQAPLIADAGHVVAPGLAGVLSDEELAMLLADDPPSQRGSRSR